MSKIGQKLISIEGVQTTVEPTRVVVKNSTGEIAFDLPNGLKVAQNGNELEVTRTREDKKTKALHGLFRNLISNAVEGSKKPWEKRLEIVGTGFNVKMQGTELHFKLGFSHPVIVKQVPGITFAVDGNTKITVSGPDRQQVGQVAHGIKMLRKPDVYKGKGIRYEGEKLRLKPGKKAKAAGA
jgi:large subunit ribosomal protein L6